MSSMQPLSAARAVWPHDRRRGRLNWLNASFLTAIHLAAIVAVVRLFVSPPAWRTVVLGLVWYWCSGLSVTGGYHRLFAHRSYRCSPLVSAFYLLFGAACAQNSALTWASDHRRHHARTDSDDDPYDARRGLWWSHIGWVFFDVQARDYLNVRDLLRNRLVWIQHRFYTVTAIAMAGAVPVLIGWLWHDPLGAFLWVGCVRLVVQYHSAFAINSAAHRYGQRPYSHAISARDNLFVAFVTMGEGYHNFHHRFPSDYRNGTRWFDYDPTKWLVSVLATLGLASDLKRTSERAILRARRAQLGSR